MNRISTSDATSPTLHKLRHTNEYEYRLTKNNADASVESRAAPPDRAKMDVDLGEGCTEPLRGH
jgi:hypothetical protein